MILVICCFGAYFGVLYRTVRLTPFHFHSISIKDNKRFSTFSKPNTVVDPEPPKTFSQWMKDEIAKSTREGNYHVGTKINELRLNIFSSSSHFGKLTSFTQMFIWSSSFII